MFSYDELPYESRTSRATNPAHLAAVGHLFGIETAAASTARVLELGCGTGANLIAYAARSPDASCVGVDLSETAIDIGRAGIDALCLDNIDLRHGDIAALDPDELGTFDFIIANGVYTWVPRDVRPRLLDLCRGCLAESGIAVFGYHTLPGWRFSGAIGEMLRDLTRGASDRREKIRLARERIEFIAKGSTIDRGFYGEHVRTAAARIRRKTDVDFYHEYLDTVNFPVYFHEFAAAAEAHDLDYVWDSDIDTGFVDNFPPPLSDELRRRAAGLVEIEQLIDYLRNRRWRNSLLCRRGQPLRHDLDPGRIRRFRIAADLSPATTDDAQTGGSSGGFEDRRGTTIAAPNTATRAALSALADRWPADMSFDELVGIAGVGSGGEERLAADLMRLSFLGSCFLYREPVDVGASISDRPKASALARWQSAKGNDPVNQHHMTVSLDPAQRRLLALLDGTRDRRALLSESAGTDGAAAGLEMLRRSALLIG